MSARTITGISLGLYFSCFLIAALFGLSRLHTYLAASALGAATMVYAMLSQRWRVLRDQFLRWQLLLFTFLGIVTVSYLVNRESYDLALTFKVVGYVSMFVIASVVALTTGFDSVRSCVFVYTGCLVLAMIVTLAANNTNAHNHRLLGPGYVDGIVGSGLHHNEVGLLGMTAVMLATLGGWRPVLLVTPLSVYTAYLSGSRGSMLGIVLALIVFAVVTEFVAGAAHRERNAVPKRGILLIGAGLLLFLAIAMFAGGFLLDDVLQISNEKRGLQSGFTGRTDVWNMMIDRWRERPVIGCGYGIVRGEALALKIPADGGFLLLTSELGLAGLSVFLFVIGRALCSAWTTVQKFGDRQSTTTLVFVVTFVFINVFESRLVGTGSIGLGMFVYFGCLRMFYPGSENAETIESAFGYKFQPDQWQGSRARS